MNTYNYIIDKSELRGKRSDEVLRSDAFGLLATASPESVSDITRYCELIIKRRRTPKENKELSQLKTVVKYRYTFGDTDYEEIVEKAVIQTLTNLLSRKPSEIHMLETKRQLSKIFRDEDE